MHMHIAMDDNAIERPWRVAKYFDNGLYYGTTEV